MAHNPEEGWPVYTHVFPSAGDYDLTSTSYWPSNRNGYNARIIEILTPGTLVVTVGGSNKTLAAAPAGHKFFGQFEAIVSSGSTEAEIVVSW